MIAPVVVLWTFGALGFLLLWAADVALDSEAMPGGGAPAMVAALWPLVIVAAIIGVIMYVVTEVS